jgi:hypothetical protein
MAAGANAPVTEKPLRFKQIERLNGRIAIGQCYPTDFADLPQTPAPQGFSRCEGLHPLSLRVI